MFCFSLYLIIFSVFQHYKNVQRKFPNNHPNSLARACLQFYFFFQTLSYPSKQSHFAINVFLRRRVITEWGLLIVSIAFSVFFSASFIRKQIFNQSKCPTEKKFRRQFCCALISDCCKLWERNVVD